MPLFQLLLHCLSSSQHCLKAFRDRNLVFFSLFLSGTGQQHSLWLYGVGHTVCPLLAGLPCPISESLPRTPQTIPAGRLLVYAELGRVSRDMGKGAEVSSSHRGCSPCTLLLSPCPLLFSPLPPCQHPKHGTGPGIFCLLCLHPEHGLFLPLSRKFLSLTPSPTPRGASPWSSLPFLSWAGETFT